MKNIAHSYSNQEQLKLFLTGEEFHRDSKTAKSILVQIFSAYNNQQRISEIIYTIKNRLPAAKIIGTTTVGEIKDGCFFSGQIVISFSFFYFAQLQILGEHCRSGAEAAAGDGLIHRILEAGNEISGVLLYATPLTIDVSKAFASMSTKNIFFPIFGGGAGVYDTSGISTIFSGDEFIGSGMLAVVFLGKELQIYCRTNLGWHPLSREMVITETEGKIARKIDGMKAFDLYKKYLDIKNDENFFLNVLEFPLLVEREGYTVARVPLYAREDGSIEFIADIVEGEKCRIGYGDPDSIIHSAEGIRQNILKFEPEAIFIYACICRRFLMQNDVNLETQPFDRIAPTTGFFTYGEFLLNEGHIAFLNSTIIVVGMREGTSCSAQKLEQDAKQADPAVLAVDPYSGQHHRIVSRLLHFIGSLSSELEHANDELMKISEMDRLTQVSNRLKLEMILKNEILKCGLLKTEFAVILIDIDWFKNVNDCYGHLAGDRVLNEFASLLQRSVRKVDSVGRWGGEEFLLVLTMTGLAQAVLLADKIRKSIEGFSFSDTGHMTCSMGVAAYCDGETQEKLIHRADVALYRAKNSGRNRVEMEAGQGQ